MKKNFFLFFLLPPLLAFSHGGSITSNRYNTSLIGVTPSYGQLYFSTSTPLDFVDPNTWVTLPFNAFSPSYQVEGSTSFPATLTVVKTGVYQMNITLYFSSEESQESTFNHTLYTLGISLNGQSPVPAAAVYAGQAGELSLNYNVVGEFFANDYIQFSIKSSALGGSGEFNNVVTLIQGNANLVQIAN